jgi:cobaltochelatase CobS
MTQQIAKSTTSDNTQAYPWTDLDKEYIPELIPDYYMPDDMLWEVLQDVRQSKPVIFTGHAGTGKSSFILQVAARANKGVGQPVMRINFSDQATIGDLLGYSVIENGEVVWKDGPVTIAMRRGYWLVLDELDSGAPELLSIINPIAEKGGFLVLKEKHGEIVKPHPKFRLFGTGNTIGVMEEYAPLYQGTRRMNAALIDRARVYHVKYLPIDKESETASKITGCPIQVAKYFCTLANHCRNLFEQHQMQWTFSMRTTLELCELFLRHKEQALDKKSKGLKYLEGTELVNHSITVGMQAKMSKEDWSSVLNTLLVIENNSK